MVPVDRVRGLAVDLRRVPFGDIKTNKPMMWTGYPEVSVKVRIDVRIHVIPALNSTKEDEVYPSGMVTMYECWCPGSKAWQNFRSYMS